MSRCPIVLALNGTVLLFTIYFVNTVKTRNEKARKKERHERKKKMFVTLII